MRKKLLDNDQEARQDRSNAEYLDGVKSTYSGGVDPNDDDDCLTTFIGLGFGITILIDAFANFFQLNIL